MEGIGDSSAKQLPDKLIGEIPPLSSFLSANNEIDCFGSFRIPKSFLDDFGNEILTKVRVKCKTLSWTAKVNVQKRKIYGLRRFMQFYGIKLLNMIQFNYYAKDFFTVTIFKESAVELKYPSITPEQFFSLDNSPVWKETEYVIHDHTVEFQKKCALWSFNAFRNCVHYYQIEISDVELDQSSNCMKLKTELQPLYKNWHAGEKVNFLFTEKTWEIEIQWMRGSCYLGKGWNEFAFEAELEVGDTIVLFNLESGGPHTLNCCLFKGEHKVVYNDIDKAPWNKSFFKILSEESLVDGALAVPKMFKEIFIQNLKEVVVLEIANHTWFVIFNSSGGYLSNLGEVMKTFRLRPRETIIFTIDNSSLLYGRIYQEDGKEINYADRVRNIFSGITDKWFWNVEWESNTGSGEQHAVLDDPATVQMSGTESEFPDFIIVSKADQTQSGKLGIPPNLSQRFGVSFPSNVTFQFPPGNSVKACFSYAESSFSDTFEFQKEITKFGGSYFLFNYKGGGHFFVNVLNHDGIEVHYKRSRYHLRPPTWDPDYVVGVGVKFLISIGRKICDSGILEIPELFYKQIGGRIPPSIQLICKDGEVFTCKFLTGERNIVGLLKLFEMEHVEWKDFLLFTYYGSGKFHVVVFDKLKVEKALVPKVAAEDINMVEGMEAGTQELVVNAGNIVNEMNMQFTVCLKMSNVDNKCHGTHIPRHINPHNRNWEAGEVVRLTTMNGSWTIGLVLNKGVARFSSGWNHFIRDNQLRRNDKLNFTFLEQEDGIVFNIVIENV